MLRRVLYASSQSYVDLEQVFDQENARSVEVLGCSRFDQFAATATASDICGRLEPLTIKLNKKHTIVFYSVTTQCPFVFSTIEAQP